MPVGGGGGARRVYWRRSCGSEGGGDDGDAPAEGVEAPEGGDGDPDEGGPPMEEGDHDGIGEAGDAAEPGDDVDAAPVAATDDEVSTTSRCNGSSGTEARTRGVDGAGGRG